MRPIAVTLTMVGAAVVTAEDRGARSRGVALFVGNVDAEPSVKGRPAGGELMSSSGPDFKGVPPVASWVANPCISANGGTEQHIVTAHFTGVVVAERLRRRGRRRGRKRAWCWMLALPNGVSTGFARVTGVTGVTGFAGFAGVAGPGRAVIARRQ